MSMKRLRYGMVGGASGAFIGDVHRKAIASGGQADLTAACFSTDEQKNSATGEFYRLDPARVYRDYREMAEKEAGREDKIDFVSIVTPNVTHYEIAKAFLGAGIHVMCEKPLCFYPEQAQELEALAKEKNLFFGVMYAYSGYGMLKLARELTEQGVIGEVVNVNAEYLQEWLIDEIGGGNQKTAKLSGWRTDPAVAGASNCVGDIGSHIEHTVSYITGLRIRRLSAVLDNYGMELDMNANMLIEFENGAHGVFNCSQVCAGHLNGLVVRIFGTQGAIEWVQEEPDRLKVTRKGEPVQIYGRGAGYVEGRAAQLNHIPSGHPEGLVFGFANVYHDFINTVRKAQAGATPDRGDLDFPTVTDGVHGVQFINAAIKSSENDAAWTAVSE